MQEVCIDPKRKESEALPRDISRFRKLYPNGRATIKDNPAPTLGFISTLEMIHDARQ